MFIHNIEGLTIYQLLTVWAMVFTSELNRLREANYETNGQSTQPLICSTLKCSDFKKAFKHFILSMVSQLVEFNKIQFFYWNFGTLVLSVSLSVFYLHCSNEKRLEVTMCHVGMVSTMKYRTKNFFFFIFLLFQYKVI